MKQLLDLDTFTKTLTDKGYLDYFFIPNAPFGNYGRQLKERLEEYVENCQKGIYIPEKHEIQLKCYLEWLGEDAPWTECHMRVRYEDGKFDVQSMDIERKDGYGNSIKKLELTNLRTESVPTEKEAFAKVLDTSMKTLDLNTFAKILTDKGYDGYFHTESTCAGRLKNSVSEFLKIWENGDDAPLVADRLHLSTYLEWNGEDKPRVECNMWVKYEDGKFNLEETEMYIKKTDQYGQLLKQSKLTNLTTSSFPTVKEAIAQVSEKPKEQIAPRKKGFRM